MNRTNSILFLLCLLIMPFSIVLLYMSLSSNDGLVGAPLAITLLLIANVIFLLRDVSKNVVFLVFQVTFFLFLIARSVA